MEHLDFDPSTISPERLIGVGIGLSAEVVRIKDTNVVAKIPSGHIFEENDYKVEKAIYERLEKHPHPYILRYYGQCPLQGALSGALLFEYHSAGTLAHLFKKPNILLTHYQRNQSVFSFFSYCTKV